MNDIYNITVRMPARIADQLRLLANAQQRSINAQIVVLIQQAVGQQLPESTPQSLGSTTGDASLPNVSAPLLAHGAGAR